LKKRTKKLLTLSTEPIREQPSLVRKEHACVKGRRQPSHAQTRLSLHPQQRSLQVNNIKGCKVAILATDGFEQVELTEPQKALKQAGATVIVVSPNGGKIQGMNHAEKGDKIAVDAELASVKPEQFDALVLPGGVANPDYLRVNPQAVAFIKHFATSGKPIGAICHGPWTLIEADAVRGKQVTSWPSLKTDLRNAGATWVDEPMVRDGKLVTSRKPDDLKAFNAAIIDMFGEVVAKAA
jgi:protease I